MMYFFKSSLWSDEYEYIFSNDSITQATNPIAEIIQSVDGNIIVIGVSLTAFTSVKFNVIITIVKSSAKSKPISKKLTSFRNPPILSIKPTRLGAIWSLK